MNIVNNHLNGLKALRTSYKIASSTLNKKISYLESLKGDDLTFVVAGVGALSLEDMVSIRREHNSSVEALIQSYKPHVLSLLTRLSFDPSYEKIDQVGLKGILTKIYPYLSNSPTYDGGKLNLEYLSTDNSTKHILLSLIAWLLVVAKKHEPAEDQVIQTTIDYLKEMVEMADRYIWIKE